MPVSKEKDNFVNVKKLLDFLKDENESDLYRVAIHPDYLTTLMKFINKNQQSRKEILFNANL